MHDWDDAQAQCQNSKDQQQILKMAEKKIKVNAEVLSALHKELKDSIKKKAKDDNETESFINSLLKVCNLYPKAGLVQLEHVVGYRRAG